MGKRITLVISVLLALLSIAYIGKGITLLVWGADPGDAVDLKLRWTEQRYFARQINPYDVWIAHANGVDDDESADWATSRPSEIHPDIQFDDPAHPPWSFVTSWIFVWPDWPLTRIYYAGICLLAIAVCATYSYRRTAYLGVRHAVLITLGVLASGGGGLSLQVGQYGWPVIALLAGCLMFDARGAPIRSGILLALSTVKPTMGAPFLLAAWVSGRFRTLFVALLVLVMASAVTWLWINTDPVTLIRQALLMGSKIAGLGSINLTVLLINSGVNPQFATLAGMLIFGSLGACALAALRTYDLLYSFAIAGVLARVWTYHKSYDNVLLIFLFIAVAELATRPNGYRLLHWTMAGLVGLTLWIPSRISAVEHVQLAQIAIWLSATVLLIVAVKKRDHVCAQTSAEVRSPCTPS